MFSEFVSVDGVGIKGSDLIYGLVERDAVFEGSDYCLYGIGVGIGYMVSVDGEGGIAVKDRLTESLLAVVFVGISVVVLLGFGHSSPPIKAIV